MKLEKTSDDYIYSYLIKKGKRYRVRYSYYVNSKREIFDKSGIKTMSEARFILKDFKILYESKKGTIANLRTSVADYWEILYLKKIKTNQWSKATENHMIETMQRVILPRWGKYYLHEIERNNYELWISELLSKYRRLTVKTYHKDFMTLLNDAVYNMTLDKNPLMHINIGKSSKEKKKKELSIQNFKIWMSTAKKNLFPWQYAMVFLASFGLRRGEILGIKPSEVSILDNGLVELHTVDSRGEHYLNGKGGVKTDSSERYIVLDEKTSEILLSSISEVKVYCLKRYNTILSEDDFIWLNRKEENLTWATPGQFDYLFKKISKICGIHLSAHMLRHFFITQSIAAGISMEDVARYVGHSQKYMTESYTHIKNESAQRVVNGYSKYLEN